MDITVATLIYKSPAYLDFVLDSLIRHTSSKVKFLVVCNDATEEVVAHAAYRALQNPNIRAVVHNNPDPNEYWIQRVYAAWNRCLQECETEAICFVNSDMSFTDGWLENLAKHDLSKYVPTSRLVESARMPSLPGLISQNFGQTIKSFKANEELFHGFAKAVSEPKTTERVGAYMPSLFKTETLLSIRGWRPNMWTYDGREIPGDQVTFHLLEKNLGIKNLMCHDSIVYHLQRGESAESGDL